jgi:hypothetical protein
LTNPGPNEFYVRLVQDQLDRRFTDLNSDLNRRFEEVNRRFTTQDKAIEDVNKKIDKLEDGPKDTFRTYITPVIVAVITALVLTFLISRGVATQ